MEHFVYKIAEIDIMIRVSICKHFPVTNVQYHNFCMLYSSKFLVLSIQLETEMFTFYVHLSL